jgi:hypothetical protein
MSTTPNLLIQHIAASQNQKEVTANTAFDLLDEAMNSQVSKALSGTTFTLPQADALQNFFFIFTGALTANNTITLPANKKVYAVVNNTTGGFSLIFKAGTGAATVTVSDVGVPHLIYCDGANTVYQIGRPLSASDIPNLDASKITTGQLALARGGTHADLSATGGAGKVLQQASSGADISLAQLSLKLAKGSGAGDYTGTNTAYADVDATNLVLTITIPTNSNLSIVATGVATTDTGVAVVSVALDDGGTLLQETQVNPPVAGVSGAEPFTLAWVITGDGASHTIKLRAKTSNAADAWRILNSSGSLTPSMVATLLPTN